MSYAPLESYGLIGNMRSAALVCANGSIDWLCLPHFDSPSVFAAILDAKKGGSFRVHPQEDQTLRLAQHYWPDTNVLLLRMSTDEGQGELIDFMPVCVSKHDRKRPSLVRLARVEHGRMKLQLTCRPAFNYARDEHTLTIREHAAQFASESAGLVLTSSVPLHQQEGAVEAECTLEGGQSAAWSLWQTDGAASDKRGELHVQAFSPEEAEALLCDTVQYWHAWLSQCTYHGRWRELVHRSALTLKLLTFEPTGAIIAAPTCSLPEHFGGTRNWDYRYTWLRDAAFIIYALLHIGFADEAGAFMHWLEQRSLELEEGRMLQPVYGIDGRRELPENQLDHLEGYRGSSPVRIGNDAWRQLQLDVAGELADAAFLYNRDGVPIRHSMWVELRKLLNWVCINWEKPDQGVWEVRGAEHHFVHSKLMCWVALDRGVRLAQARGLPGNVRRWRRNRDAIYKSILTHGWNEQKRAFTQHYETDALDAANLLMPLVFFLSPNDPLMLDTIRAMDRPLSEGGLISDFRVHRYDPVGTDDGFDEPEGAFTMCTFWLIEAMTRAGHADHGRLEKARMLFERAIAQASPLGLFAEQTTVQGDSAGNYPQGLTHLSLIITTCHLDRALDKNRRSAKGASAAQEMQ